ncbi:MAG TPA: nucleotidyltransferase domain-containing protein [Actinomycetota bacterium]
MEHRIIARRRAEREQLIQLAADYVRHLSTKLPVLAAYVAGSAARGDFNVWSDVDVVIVAEGLPERIPDRMALLASGAPPRVQPVGFTPREFEAAHEKGNPLVVEALSLGIALFGPRREGETETRTS